MTQKETLTSLAVQRREKEKHEARLRMNREMRQRQVDLPQRVWNQREASTTDLHMREALAKVREKEDITIPHSLSRFHGTTIYNKPDRGGG